MMIPQNNNIMYTNNTLDLADVVTNDNNKNINQMKHIPLLLLQKQKQKQKQQQRTLSSYIIYFQLERKRMIYDVPHDQLFTTTDIINILEERSRPRLPRRHRKTHGKVSFTEMTKVISRKWKSLDKKEKEIFELNVNEATEKYNNHQEEQKIIGIITTSITADEMDIIPRLEKTAETTTNTGTSNATKTETTLRNIANSIPQLETIETTTNTDSISDNTAKNDETSLMHRANSKTILLNHKNNNDGEKYNDNISLNDSFNTRKIEQNQSQCCFTNKFTKPSEHNAMSEDILLNSNLSHHDSIQHTFCMKKDYDGLFVVQNEQLEQEDFNDDYNNILLSKEIRKIRRRIQWRNAIIIQHTKRLKAHELLPLNQNHSSSFVNDYIPLPITEHSLSQHIDNGNFYNTSFNNMVTNSSDLLNSLPNANDDFYIKNSNFISSIKHQESLHLEEKDWNNKSVPMKLKNYNNHHFQSMTFIDENETFKSDNFF